MNSEDSRAFERLDELAEEFARRLRNGESVSIEDYAALYPELADPIREVFPALERVEVAALGRVSETRRVDQNGPAETGETGMEGPGSVVGNYRLVSQLGEGGFGRVFLCEQLEPVQRQVALKLIKPGMDSREVIARFEAERQTLAMLDHPNIARVYDGGTTKLGRPYFVMELVNGSSMTRYCDEHRLTIRERIELLLDVCSGIQHAHQKGVIHRDIKPSNILVTEVDGRPICKVIDFGVSKALEQTGISSDHPTRTSQMIGTPLYMSPEQARSGSQDIDTRSDIYSLGALLYELLTGTTPFRREQLSGLSLSQIQNIITEHDIDSLQKRMMSHDSSTAQQIASMRHSEYPRISREIAGELEWITSKALNRDRSRRYQTAGELTEDLQRYLCGDRVLACPDGRVYRIRKFVHKHWVAISFTATLLLALLIGLLGTSLGLMRALRAESKAKQFSVRESKARVAETIANQLNLKRVAQLERINAILGEVFGDLDINSGRSSDLELHALLSKRLMAAAEVLNAEATGEPVTVAKLRYRIGSALHGLGETKAATSLLETALSDFERAGVSDLDENLWAKGMLARCYESGNEHQKAEKLYIETSDSMLARLGPHHRDTLTTRSSLARFYGERGDKGRASGELEEIIELQRKHIGTSDITTLHSMYSLGVIYKAQNRLSLAISLLEETLKLQTKALGPRHRWTLNTMNHLADAHRKSGDFETALRMFEENFILFEQTTGADSSVTRLTKAALADIYRDTKRYGDANRLGEELLREARAREATPSDETLSTMRNLAKTYTRTGQLDRAVNLYEDVAKAWLEKRVRDNMIPKEYSRILERLGRYDEAMEWREALTARQKEALYGNWKSNRERLGDKNVLTIADAIVYSMCLVATGDHSANHAFEAEFPSEVFASREILRQEETIPDHQKVFDELIYRNFIPVDFVWRMVGNEARIDTTYRRSLPTTRPFEMRTGLTQEEFDTKQAQCEKSGMELVRKQVIDQNGSMLLGGLWHRKELPHLAIGANTVVSHADNWGTRFAVNDGLVPLSSNDRSIERHTWMSHLGSAEWIEYQFAQSLTVDRSLVYWFEDTDTPGCRVPMSWKLNFFDKESSTWKPVLNLGEFGVFKDRFNEVRFEPVTTTALRLEVQLQPEFSAGILEWQVFGDNPAVPVR